MDGNVAEGISTSPQTRPFSQPQGLQKLYAPEGLPSPPFSCHLHVNDLGLTPPPGSQQQPADVTQESSQDERGASDKNAAVAGESAPTEPMQQTEGLPTDTEEVLCDPLFDSDLALQDLESAFLSHKRAHDEAFPEDFGLEGPPEKRQAQYASNSAKTPPNVTPSLSPDSSYRPDLTETALNTPDGIEGSQAPNSFFESLDFLFQDPNFPAALENYDSAANPADSSLFENLPFRPSHEDSHVSQPAAAQSVSNTTRQRFALDAQDLTANSSREILQRADNVPQYLSPYPVYGGPLGYLPSAPGLHVKCVEVVDEHMNYRMECLRHKNQQLTSERNKYKNFYDEFSTKDEATGKSKEEMLLEENAMLRRVSTRHQSRVENYKKEIEHWKARLNQVATLYNNLLYEITVERKLPEVAAPPNNYTPRPVQGVFVQAQPPVSHQPPVADPRPQLQPPGFPRPSCSSQASTTTPQLKSGNLRQPVPGQEPANVSQKTLPGPARQHPETATFTANPAPLPPLSSLAPASGNGRSLQSVTIDLTDDHHTAPSPPPHPAVSQPGGPEGLQALRQKKYHWLGRQDEIPTSNATSHQQQQRPSLSNNAPRTSPVTEAGNHQPLTGDDSRPDNRIPGLSPQEALSGERGITEEDDELARMMEDELAQGN